MERQAVGKVQKTPSRANHLQTQSARSPSAGHPLLELQRSIGNQAVQRLIRSPYIQTKLKISTPGDPFEREADRVADTVMRMREPEAKEEEEERVQTKPLAIQITPLVQREADQPIEEEKEETIATKPIVQRAVPLAVREDDEEEKVATKLIQRLCTECEEDEQSGEDQAGEMVQRKSVPEQLPDDDEVEGQSVQRKVGPAQAPQVTNSVAANIHAMNGGGSPLPNTTRAFFEPRFGADFSQVRVHTDSKAAKTANTINATAFTVGPNIAFGTGRYSPHSDEGRQLLAHELTHVVQQSGAGGIRAGQSNGKLGRSPILMIMRWDRDPSGRFTPAARIQLGVELMRRGVNFNQLGDLDALADLGNDAAIRALLDTLDVIKKGGGPLGDPNRIIRSWNANMDDIGFTNPRGLKYKTILHYVAELDRLAQASMGKDYLEAVKAMPNVRLSGVRVHSGGVGVHPRAVYFVAAGQIGIDDAAREAVAKAAAEAKNDPNRQKAAKTMERAFGEGHYIPAGGFRWLFIDVVRMLTTLGFSKAPNPRARGAAAKGVQRATALERGKLIYDVMRLEIERMLLVLEGQETGVGVPSHEAAAHRERELRAFLLPRKKDIEAVAAPKDDDDVARAAREMLTALGSPPSSLKFTHGGGTIDPHGTDHAMGLAFDFYNGTDSLGVFRRNFKVEHWPFIHRVISEHGDDDTLETKVPKNLRPSSIDAVSPEIAQAIAELLRKFGAQVATEMLAEADAADVEEKADPKLKKSRAATLKLFKRLRGDVRNGMARRRAAINQVSDANKRHLPPAVKDELLRLARDLRGLEGVVPNFSATDIIEMLDGIDTRLGELRAQAQAHAASAQTEATTAETAAQQELTTREEEATSKERADLADLQAKRDEELNGLDQQINDVGDSLTEANPDAKTRRDLARKVQTLKDLKAKTVRKWKDAEKRAQTDLDKKTRPFAKERAAAATKARTAATARKAAALALAKVVPDPDPLQDLEFKLHEIEGDADLAAAIEIDRALRPGLKSASFKKSLQILGDVDNPIFDQPRVVKAGLDKVLAHEPIGGRQTSHFFSGHHWTIAPREILTSPDAYRASLDNDMKSRDIDNLRRVLSVMAESLAGQAILFGPATARDKTFDNALEARLKADNITSKDFLDQVKAQVVTPYESLTGESGKLLKGLRDRGHFLVKP